VVITQVDFNFSRGTRAVRAGVHGKETTCFSRYESPPAAVSMLCPERLRYANEVAYWSRDRLGSSRSATTTTTWPHPRSRSPAPVTQDATMKMGRRRTQVSAQRRTRQRATGICSFASSVVGVGSQHCSGKLELNRDPLPRSDGLEVPACGHPRGTRVVAAEEEGQQ
jgi:hypothetical protein